MDHKRISSIDTLRVFAILGVISIHVNSYYGWGENFGLPKYILSAVNQLRSLAVPVFFMISGYLFGKSFQKEKNINRLYFKNIQRLLFIFVAWTLIYAFPHLSNSTWQSIHEHGWIRTYFWNLQYISTDPLTFLMTGGTWHLWFIMALVQALTIIFIFQYLHQDKLLLYFSLFLFILTPLVNLYIPPAPPPGDYVWNPLLWPLISTAPVVIGWWLSKHEKHSPLLAYTCLATGIFICLTHKNFLEHFYQVHSSYGNLGVLFMSAGIVLIALINPRIGANTFLPFLGRLTLGVYCAHMLVLDYLKDLDSFFEPRLWHAVLPFIVYLGSIAIALLLKTNRWTRKLVV